ncbi:uncharacterized protein LOC118433837 [Folsomia candida]|nr:uncharacterized protein LOC118433837 [Folsomia candida]
MMRIFIPTAEFSLPVIVLLLFSLLTYAPCTAPFIVSMQQYCNNGMQFSAVRLTLHLFEAWMVWHILMAGGTWIIYAFLTGVVAILSIVGILEGKIKTIQTEANMNSCIKFYQRIQILQTLMNSFLRDRLLPVMMLFVPGIQVIAQYVTIDHHSDITMPGFLIFPLIGLNCGANNVLAFTLASFVNSGSEKVMATLRKKSSQLRGKKALMKRQLRGCTALQVKFGSNYIDRGTPLVVQTFCINQTASLTLIKEGKSIRY